MDVFQIGSVQLYFFHVFAPARTVLVLNDSNQAGLFITNVFLIIIQPLPGPLIPLPVPLSPNHPVQMLLRSPAQDPGFHPGNAIMLCFHARRSAVL